MFLRGPELIKKYIKKYQLRKLEPTSYKKMCGFKPIKNNKKGC